MSVLDNILVGRYCHQRSGLAAAFAYYPFAHREEVEHRAVAEEIISFLEIEHVRHQAVGTLGYGMRKRVTWAAPWRWTRRCCCSTSRWLA
jgi:branched-chain amino acid transport system ATP-binding protein